MLNGLCMRSSVILMYHDVVNDLCPKSGRQIEGALQYTISDMTFEAHVKQTIKDDIVYTFDDGGCSFISPTADILERYNKKAIYFIATSYLNTPFFLTKEEVKELDNRGHIIASHSHTHPEKISSLTREECLKEWKVSKSILEDIVGHSVSAASIPGGDISDMVIDCMVDAGYTEIYTSEPTTVVKKYKGVHIIGRYGITQSMSSQKLFTLIHNQHFRNKLLLKYKILTFAKVVLGDNYNKIKQFALRLRR